MPASNLTFIVAAYGVTWVVLLAYLAHLVRDSQRARVNFERVAQQAIGENGP